MIVPLHLLYCKSSVCPSTLNRCDWIQLEWMTKSWLYSSVTTCTTKITLYVLQISWTMSFWKLLGQLRFWVNFSYKITFEGKVVVLPDAASLNSVSTIVLDIYFFLRSFVLDLYVLLHICINSMISFLSKLI